MGKAGKWLRSFLASKKDKPQSEEMTAVTPKEKRWSFRRPVTPGKAALPQEQIVCEHARTDLSVSEPEFDEKKQAVAVAVATAAAADATVAAVQAAAAVIPLSSGKAQLSASFVEEAAAVRIQATFRGYLARKALCALRGIVKLQALVRGQLVRKQANATLRCMQALVTAQYHLRAHHMRMLQEHSRPPKQRRSPQHPAARRSYEMDTSWEKNAKIVEMDSGEPLLGGASRSRNGHSVVPSESNDRRRFSEYYSWYSPAPSAMTELSPRAYSGHFEVLAFATAQSSPQYVSEPVAEFFPSYMANTESSRAKTRSQSAPRQRADALERQPSRRKVAEPRNVLRSAKMQRSSSHVGAAARGGQYPWSVKLDASSASLKDSECGSTSSVLTTNTVYSRTRSLVGFEVRGGQY